ncbi:protein of unknown function DUF262 [Desulforamulus reducens MI-1]|uniref:DUF262 domain-containing protein n=1 Tax=Desulforamulus reducens (strain ATCC BAA-1160 / DSM 100696 / MI-1) TaxID=349161 RepID=A4J1V4_DESRM|nr:DUF262 domain-containing protein [Desulforamulus reducens]ABO49057.1 protein of unknown function DUF262 [Desulforamulus reducens MI-1]
MKASETKLQAIIEGNKQYIVPLFQRTYSWEKKDWEMLWKDIMELLEEDNPRSHFIGSIVTMPAASVPEGVPKYLLIDGQQRLTTIFILLAALRDKATQCKQTLLGEEINNTLLVNPYKSGLDHYKLQPTQVDRASFHNIIDDNSISSVDKITGAYQFFERKLKPEHIDAEKIKDIITGKLSIVSIVLDPDDNPYLVFESLNAKGRPLTQSDLIRNYFFMRIHVSEQEKIYHQYWKPMEEALGETLTEFIRHYLMRNGANVKQSDVYFSLKEIINREDALTYLKVLSRYAGYYEKLLNPMKEEKLNLRKALQRINCIEVNTAYPFLLNCYEDYFNQVISADEFYEVLKTIENFAIRRFVCNVPTNTLNKIFPALYNQVLAKKAESFASGVKDILQTKGYPKDVEFTARLQDVKLYGSGDRAVKAKLILETFEESYQHKEQVPLDDCSIEHIMPQTLTEGWQSYLGEDWELTHELLLHTIGNLTLTKYNSELSNLDYNSKKQLLQESHLEINKFFQDVDTWKKEDIKKRSEHLAELALQIWPYFGEAGSEPTNQTGITGTTPTGLWILGQYFTVSSWRDVLEQTLNTIAELEPEKMDLIMQQFPRFVGPDKNKFRAIRTLKNGTFIEVNLSAKSIERFCFQALQAVELSNDDWKVEIA